MESVEYLRERMRLDLTLLPNAEHLMLCTDEELMELRDRIYARHTQLSPRSELFQPTLRLYSFLDRFITLREEQPEDFWVHSVRLGEFFQENGASIAQARQSVQEIINLIPPSEPSRLSLTAQQVEDISRRIEEAVPEELRRRLLDSTEPVQLTPQETQQLEMAQREAESIVRDEQYWGAATYNAQQIIDISREQREAEVDRLLQRTRERVFGSLTAISSEDELSDDDVPVLPQTPRPETAPPTYQESREHPILEGSDGPQAHPAVQEAAAMPPPNYEPINIQIEDIVIGPNGEINFHGVNITVPTSSPHTSIQGQLISAISTLFERSRSVHNSTRDLATERLPTQDPFSTLNEDS